MPKNLQQQTTTYEINKVKSERKRHTDKYYSKRVLDIWKFVFLWDIKRFFFIRKQEEEDVMATAKKHKDLCS